MERPSESQNPVVATGRWSVVLQVLGSMNSGCVAVRGSSATGGNRIMENEV